MGKIKSIVKKNSDAVNDLFDDAATLNFWLSKFGLQPQPSKTKAIKLQGPSKSTFTISWPNVMKRLGQLLPLSASIQCRKKCFFHLKWQRDPKVSDSSCGTCFLENQLLAAKHLVSLLLLFVSQDPNDSGRCL
jgi:hypothetical protein